MNIPNRLSKAACLIVSICPNGEIGSVVRAESVTIDATQYNGWQDSVEYEFKAICTVTGADISTIRQIIAQTQTNASIVEAVKEFAKSNEEIEIPDLEPIQTMPEQKRPKFWKYDKRRCFKQQNFWKRIRSRTW